MEALAGPCLVVMMVAGAFVLAGLIVWFSIKYSERVNASWAEAAHQLGLDFSPGGFFKRRTIQGVLNGRRVLVDSFSRGSGKNRRTYSRIRTWFHPPLGLGLKVYREGLFQAMGKFLGTQDIQTGDAAFDGRFMIKGSDETRVLQVLSADVRGALAAYDGHYGLNINDERLYYEKSGSISDGQIIHDVLVWQSQTVDAVVRANAGVTVGLRTSSQVGAGRF